MLSTLLVFVPAVLALGAMAAPSSARSAGGVSVDCGTDVTINREYLECVWENQAAQCIDKSGADYTACSQLWQVFCGEKYGCTVTDN
ncbi:hypothetical protein GGR56DRAFT_677563 [Xylariaceae sp. FL0804]|nr:hypothetical protein GGR56DRAFT_677563 [Xylariaceae sp. FL0804]